MGSKETVVRAVVDVKKGDRIAVLLDPIDGNISFDATNVMVCATYLSAEGEENPDESHSFHRTFPAGSAAGYGRGRRSGGPSDQPETPESLIESNRPGRTASPFVPACAGND